MCSKTQVLLIGYCPPPTIDSSRRRRINKINIIIVIYIMAMLLTLVSTFKCYIMPPLGIENVDTVDTYTREYININCIIIYYF